jgi:hypothetical protein
MIPNVALVLAFALAPYASVTFSTERIPQVVASTLGNNSKNLDRVSEKFTARSLAGEYTLALTAIERTRSEAMGIKTFTGKLVLNADRTFQAEFQLFGTFLDRKEISPSLTQMIGKGKFNVDGNTLRLIPTTAQAIRDGKAENVSATITEFTISANGQLLQSLGETGYFLVKK